MKPRLIWTLLAFIAVLTVGAQKADSMQSMPVFQMEAMDSTGCNNAAVAACGASGVASVSFNNANQSCSFSCNQPPLND